MIKRPLKADGGRAALLRERGPNVSQTTIAAIQRLSVRLIVK
ncbi:hypothetical protein [Bradyrhizobium cenepequi]|nr:hypothetical protein [Bradyrhizobium cenepequi]